eukprot:contig_26870_g6608
MRFGPKVAPYLWTKICRPVVQALRREGFRIIAYVDKFGGGPPTRGQGGATKDKATAAGLRVRELFASFVLNLHPTKGEWHGTSSLPLLGFLVDTERRLFLLRPDRTQKIVGMAGVLLAAAKTHRRWVRHSALRSFCGVAVASLLAVPDARFRMRSLYTAMRDYRDKASNRVRLGRQAMTDLSWRNTLTKYAERARALWPAPPDVVMTTDASGSGWGATWDGLVPARGYHAAPRKGLHINLLELGAVRLGLLSFVHFLREPGTIIRLRTDSRVAMEVANSGTSRSPELMRELRKLHMVCQALGVTLRAEYLQSALNLWADRLSRTRDSTDWTLPRDVFLAFNELYRAHTVDLFTTTQNAQCGRFFSKFPAPGGAGVDALRAPWGAENAWVNPPFNLSGPVVEKIVADGGAATLGADTARRLVAAKYQGTTKGSYINAWERFVAFCDRIGARPLPAAPEAVVRYMASLHDGGTCAPNTVSSYLTAVRAVHRVAGLTSPTDDMLVADARVGLRRLHTVAVGALPEVRGPLPPDVVTQLVAVGLSTTDDACRRECAGVVLAYLMFNRPGAAANVHVQEVRLTSAGFQVQVPVYKMGVLKKGARLAFTIPVAMGGWTEDPALRL